MDSIQFVTFDTVMSDTVMSDTVMPDTATSDIDTSDIVTSDTVKSDTVTSDTTSTQTFASGRYSKRKRTQVTYHLDDLDYSDSESDFERPQAKVRCTAKCTEAHTNTALPEVQSQKKLQTASTTQDLSLLGTTSGDSEYHL